MHVTQKKSTLKKQQQQDIRSMASTPTKQVLFLVQDWRDSVLGFLLNFADLEASPNYRVGVQLYGSIVETIDK